MRQLASTVHISQRLSGTAACPDLFRIATGLSLWCFCASALAPIWFAFLFFHDEAMLSYLTLLHLTLQALKLLKERLVPAAVGDPSVPVGS